MMHTVNQMKTKFGRVFSTEQAEVLSEVINDAYTDLVKTSDFNELKDIVKDLGLKVGELAEAQKRTENRVEELAEAQKRTENRVEELAEAQKRTELELQKLVIEHQNTRQQLGGLAQSVGYGLEDKIMPYMLDFVKKNYGMDAEIVERRNIVYPDGRFDELNIYIEGAKNGQKVFAVGECKAKPGKKDVDKFHKIIERVRVVLEGVIFPFLVGFGFDPEVENYIRENYPQTRMFKSYEFELKYKRSDLQ
ncbi:MAG: hypothetical protein JSV88_22925 [Candidatus Aminicenantes bacterium]|nr:MAG: hypothetical protein JSV88_22925 [Candidatus Aminicenantes bacterium]